jgi:hypothetical protein
MQLYFFAPSAKSAGEISFLTKRGTILATKTRPL